MQEKIKNFLAGRYEQALFAIKKLRADGDTLAADGVLALFEDAISSKIDSVTQLVQYQFFYERLTEQARVLLPSFEKEGVFPEVSERDIILLGGELAFLDHFKAMSPSAGDFVLRRVAGVLNSSFADTWVSRLGDNEFAAYVVGMAVEEVRKRKRVVEAEVSNQPLHYIDLEYGSFIDVASFLKLHPLPSKERIVFIVQALVNIVRARARIAKYYKRIDLLLSLHQQNEGKYTALMEVVRKGAGGITKDQFLDLAKRHQEGLPVAVDCLAFALTAVGQVMQDAGYFAAIFKVAESVFAEVP